MIPFAIASRGPRGGRGKNSRLSGNDLVEISGRTADWLARMAGVTIEQMASGIACCKANPSIQGYTCYDDQGNPVWNSAGYTGPIPKPCGGQPSGGGGGAPAPAPSPAPSPSPSPAPAPAPTPPAGGGAAFPIAPVIAPSPAQQNNPPGQPVGPPPTNLPPCCTAIQSHTDPTKWAIFCKVAPNQGQIGHSGDPEDPAFQAWMEQNGSACLPQNQQQAPTPTPAPLPPVPRPMPAQPIPPAAQAPTPAPLPPAAQVNPVQAANPVIQPVRFPFQPPPRGYVVPVLPYPGGRRRIPPAKPSVTAVPVSQVEKLLAQTESAWHTALRIIINGDKCSPSAAEKAASDQATACLQAFQKAAGELRSATNELCAAKKSNRAANLTQAQVNALNTLADCVSQITAQSVQKATKAKGDDLVTAAVSLGLTAVGAIAISV